MSPSLSRLVLITHDALIRFKTFGVNVISLTVATFSIQEFVPLLMTQFQAFNALLMSADKLHGKLRPDRFQVHSGVEDRRTTSMHSKERIDAVEKLNREESDSQASDSTSKVGELTKRVSEQEKAIRILSDQLALKQDQLDRITGTLGWRVLSRYGRIKYKYLLPAYRRFSRRAAEVQSEASHSTNKLDVSAVLKSGSGKPDIVCLPIGEWDSYLFQRPQQILSRFAADGSRVFYLSNSKRVRGIQELSSRVYGFRVDNRPGNRSTDRIEKRTLERMISSVDILRREAEISNGLCIVESPYWTPLPWK